MLKKISDSIYKITGILISIDLAVIVCLSFAQVASRYLFSFSITWAQELITYLLVWLVFLGCSMGLRDHEVAALTIVVDKFTPKGKEIMSIAVQILLILFCVIGIWANNEVILNMWNKKSSIMRMNLGYVSLAFTVSSAIIIFNSLLEIMDHVIALVKGSSQEETV